MTLITALAVTSGLVSGVVEPAQAALLGAFACLPASGLSTVNPPDDLLAGKLVIPGRPAVSIGRGRLRAVGHGSVPE